MKAKFELWGYDVWGNAKDGYEVNDRFKIGELEINIKPKKYFIGTIHEFTSYEPTDRQLNRAISEQGCEWSGESNYVLYATRKRDGMPICELVRIKE